MTKEKIYLQIKQLVKKRLKLESLPEDEFCLFGQVNQFDSITLLEFLLELEEEFDIVVADEDLVPANFETINKIGNYIYGLYTVDDQV